MRNFLGLADMATPPEGYDKYIWTCYGCVKGISWCKNHGKAYEVLPNKWRDEKKVDDAVVYLKCVREKLIAALAEELNDYLNEKYDLEAWKVLLYSWLSMYLFQLYDKYLNLKYVNNNTFYADALVQDTLLESVSDDNLQYARKMHTDHYNLYQYSLLVDIMKNDTMNRIVDRNDSSGCDRSIEEAKEKCRKRLNIKNGLTELLLRIMKKIGMVFSGKGAILIGLDSGMPKTLLLRCWLKTRTNAMPVVYSQEKVMQALKKITLDAEWRKIPLKSPRDMDDFSAIAFELVKRELPVVYAEGHAILKRWLNKECGALKKATVFLCAGNSVAYDAFSILLYAEMRNKGGEIYGIQHGGNYGIEKTWRYDDEIALSDKFYTWGWTRDVYGGGNKLMKPMPSLKATHKKYFESHNNKDVLYVTYSSGRYPLWETSMELHLGERMLEERAFLKKIRDDIRKYMTVRLYMQDFGWATREAILEEVGEVKFDECASITESINRHSFIIISDWETTVNEVLFSGKPFVFLRDTSHLTDEAVPYIEELHRLGVACFTWDELMARIEEIYPNHKAWWQDPSRQGIINKVKAKYAWRADNAEELWVEEIERLWVEKR